jgi:hypothetical protein
LNCVGAVCTAVHSKSPLTDWSGSPHVTYEGVVDPQITNSRSLTSPKNAHRFCLGCGESKFHFPVTCEVLESWKQKMMDEVEQLVEDGESPGGDEKYGDIAQRLWMRANTRPCPKARFCSGLSSEPPHATLLTSTSLIYCSAKHRSKRTKVATT